MKQKSKPISGLSREKTIVQKLPSYFSEADKHVLIQDYLQSNCNKQDIWKKYTGKDDHGVLVKWMRKLGYKDSKSNENRNFAEQKIMRMKEKEDKKHLENEQFEILLLKKRISELECQLEDAEMKAIAFSTMVDIAEREFNIPIRKKFNTKPSKK